MLGIIYLNTVSMKSTSELGKLRSVTGHSRNIELMYCNVLWTFGDSSSARIFEQYVTMIDRSIVVDSAQIKCID
jgi:hypothetical protein